MAEAFAIFKIERTIGNLTFYMMEGRNFVRKKSSLTRRKVLYSPQFKNTRRNAGLMGKASKIGSRLYNALPDYWRQGWMYRAFTGEAYTMLKKRKREEEIQQVLYKRYVDEVVNRQPEEEVMVPAFEKPKRAYHKRNSEYWKNKTIKSNRRKVRKEQMMYYASLMAQASKIGSKLYGRCGRTGRGYYQYLTGLALKLLKQGINGDDILAELLPTLPGNSAGKALKSARKKAANIVSHQKGRYYFIPSLYKRFSISARVLPVNLAPKRLFFVRSG